MEDKKKYSIISENFSQEFTPLSGDEFLQPYKQWISWGKDNYPQKLIDLYNGSGFHAAIIHKKTTMTGSGFVDGNPSQENFIKNPNGSESLNDILYKCAFDLNLFGLSYINVTWNVDSTYIAQIEHIPAQKILVSKPEDNADDFVYLYSNDWKNPRGLNKPYPIAKYDPTNTIQKSQLICVKEYCVGMDYYSKPDYHSVSNWISLDNAISEYHINNVNNSFLGSVLINFNNGIPTPEEQQDLYKGIKDKLCGTNGGGEPVLLFNESAENAPTIEAFNPNNSDTRYKDLAQLILEQILSAHRVSPEIVGIQTAGKLGPSDTAAQEINFQRTVIDFKSDLLERAFNKLATINGVEGDLKIIDTTEGLKEAAATSSEAMKNATTEEIIKKIIKD